MVHRRRARPIAPDDRIAQRLRARIDKRMLRLQDQRPADGNGATTNGPTTHGAELVEDPRGIALSPKPDAGQDGADAHLPPDSTAGGSGADPTGDRAGSLAHSSRGPGRAMGGPEGAVDGVPKRARETVAAQQRYEKLREKPTWPSCGKVRTQTAGTGAFRWP